MTNNLTPIDTSYTGPVVSENSSVGAYNGIVFLGAALSGRVDVTWTRTVVLAGSAVVLVF